VNLALYFLCFRCLAQLPATQPGNRDFSKEAVVCESLQTKVVLQSDGTSTREQKARVRIQSDAGVQAYAVLHPPYFASIEKMEVLDVHITKPNGTVVASPLDSIQDAPSEIYRGLTNYSDLREKHIAVKGLEPGDLLEYSVRWAREKPLAKGQFWYAHPFLKTGIVLDEELEISVPKDREVKVKSQSVQPTTREESDRRIYSWKTENLETQTAEKLREAQGYAAIRGLLPPADVLISSFHTWEEVGRWYEELQKEKIIPSPEVKAKAEDLTKGLTDDGAKIRAIYNYVSLRYHYVAIELADNRYQPHASGEILGNQYGDCKDKHTLMVALLSSVGIRAYPALISSRTAIDTDVPSPGQFDHVITVVAKGSTLDWMDTTSEVAPFGYLLNSQRGKPALVILPDKVALQNTPLKTGFESKYINKVTGKLDADGTLQAHVEATYRGDDNELTYRLLFRRVPEAQWKEMAQKNFFGGRLGGTITAVTASSPEKTDEPFQVTYDYTLKDFFAGEKHRFMIPVSPLAIPEIKDNDLSRTTPVWLGELGEQVYESRIELPKGWSASQPLPLDLSESFAEFHGATEIVDGTLVTKRRLLLRASEVTPDQLKAYKIFQNSTSDNHRLYIFLRLPDANSLVPLPPSKYFPALADQWTDAEKAHYSECINLVAKNGTEGTPFLAGAGTCAIYQEKEHWMKLHPELAGKKEDSTKLYKCFKDNASGLIGTAKNFRATYDMCMREAYGLPIPAR
jgi:hypothetical protein